MADDVLITSNHMQKQAKRIKLILDSAGKWKLDGNTAELGYKYKNADRDGLMLKGIKAIDGLAVAEQSITVNSSAYDSDTQITISSGGGYEFTLADTVSVMITDPNTRLIAGAANSSICLTSGAANSSVFSDGNCYIDNAAPSTKIIGSFGNDTILNTGVDVQVSTGADGSSSISDYGSAKYCLNGNGDTICINNSLALTNDYYRPSENAAPIYFFGDNCNDEVYILSSGSSGRAYIKRAKNIAINMGGGADSVTIGNEVEDCTIAGGSGKDYITVDSGSAGNIYSIESGQGDDSILGWDAAKDTLQIGSAIQSSYMINQGNDLGIMFNIGSILLVGVGVGNTCTADTTILIKNGNTGAVTPSVLPYIMEGNPYDVWGGNKDLIINTDQTPAGGSKSTLRNGNENKPLTISAGLSADTIINEGSYVYIDGGESSDYITVQAQGTAAGSPTSVTNCVTINSGVGTDSVDVSQDTILSNGEVIHGAHIFKYNLGSDADYLITGFWGNDTIKLAGDYDVDYIKLNSAVAEDSFTEHTCQYIIKVNAKQRISLQSVECGTPINLVDDTGAVIIPNFKVPKEIRSSSKTFVMTGGENGTFDYSGYAFYGSGGGDSITVSAHSVSIKANAGTDVLTLTGGTNVDKEALSPNYGKVIAEKAVTIYGGIANDSVFAEEDYYTNSGTTVYASHVYQFSSGEGPDYIFGYNDNDTIQILDSEATATAVTTGASISGGVNVSIGSTGLRLKAADGYMAGKRLNLYRINANGTFDSIGFENGVGYKTLEGGAERVTVEGETPDYYRLPKIIQGTGGVDNFYVDSRYSGYTVNANNQVDTIVVDGANSVYVDGGAGDDYITVTGGSKDCSIFGGSSIDNIYIDNASNIYVDAGPGNDYITVTGGSKDCSIFGGDGNDFIYIDNASNVYIEAGTGNDYVSIMSGARNCSVTTNQSLMRAYSFNQSGNVYIMTADNKYTSIFGYKAEDTILIDGASYTQSVGSGYNYIYYEGDTSKRIALKGALAEGKVVGSSAAADYDSLAGGTKLIISVKSGDKYIDCSTQAIFIGTTGADTMQVTLDGAIVSLGGGNDSVTVSASNASINALSGSDAIWLESPATNCTIFGGASNDSIFNNSNGNIFYYTGSTGEGTDSLTAFNSNDLFFINDSDCTVTDSIVNGNARLQITKGTTNTYVLMIGKTTGDTVRIKLGAEGAIQTYTIGTGF